MNVFNLNFETFHNLDTDTADTIRQLRTRMRCEPITDRTDGYVCMTGVLLFNHIPCGWVFNLAVYFYRRIVWTLKPKTQSRYTLMDIY